MIIAHTKPGKFKMFWDHLKFKLRFKLHNYPIIYIWEV